MVTSRDLDVPTVDIQSFEVEANGEIERRARRGIATFHGLHLLTAPTGGGKTALAVYIAHGYAGRRCNACPPGTECARIGGKPWRVFTNMHSKRVLDWSAPIDSASELFAGGDGADHIIVLLDEIHQYFERRRAMRKENIEGSNFLAQARKETVKMIGTSQSLNKVDSRINDEAKSYWSVWNPDGEARRIGALIHIRADGRVPPWKRYNTPPILRWFNTSGTRNLYDTYEAIDEEKARSRPPQTVMNIRVFDENTGAYRFVEHKVSYPKAVDYALSRYRQEHMEKDGRYGGDGLLVTAGALEAYIATTFHVQPPITRRHIENYMHEEGFRATFNSQTGEQEWFFANVAMEDDDEPEDIVP